MSPSWCIAWWFAQTPAARSNTCRGNRPPMPVSCGRSPAASCGSEPVITGPDDAVANMTVIDACCAAAGLPRREPSR
jgi:hypothetical protein